MIPDINVLVAASRADHVHHKPALAWLNRAIARCDSGGSIELLPMVGAGFLRLVTNSRVFVEPTPIEAATDFLDALLAIPGVEIAPVGSEWPTLRSLVVDKRLSGNDIPDAWIAAAVKAIDGHLATFDRGFARLLGRRELTVLAPSAPRNR